jgi:hypothetical protein
MTFRSLWFEFVQVGMGRAPVMRRVMLIVAPMDGQQACECVM